MHHYILTIIETQVKRIASKKPFFVPMHGNVRGSIAYTCNSEWPVFPIVAGVPYQTPVID